MYDERRAAIGSTTKVYTNQNGDEWIIQSEFTWRSHKNEQGLISIYFLNPIVQIYDYNI